MPVLGGTVEQALEAGELVLAADGGPTASDPVLRYYDAEFPVAPGTEDLPLADLVDAQAYRLSSWREAGEALNYRRFFDVTSLVAVRVEDPVVFMATHALLLALHGHGAVDGFRIDHPDGLADPGGYLERLADATGDSWVVVEKILEGDETLPEGWRCAGTTGYDALLRVQQVLTPDAGHGGPRPPLGRRGAGPRRCSTTSWARPSGSSSTTCRPPRSTGSCASCGASCPTSTRPRPAGRSRRCSSRWTATAPTSCPAARWNPSRSPSSRALPIARERGSRRATRRPWP